METETVVRDDGADVNADARNVLSSCTVLPSFLHRVIWMQVNFRLGFVSAPRWDAGRFPAALVAGSIKE
jgi:hypothetical protein